MSLMAKEKIIQQNNMAAQYDVVIVGAGPYGLSVAAHLLAQGLKVAIFGKTLELWRNHMPDGMFLRSHWWASRLSDPHNRWNFERFFQESSHKPCYPVPIHIFIDYALWFQKQAVRDIDETYVSTIERYDERFVIRLADGRHVYSSAVVMAPGLSYYAQRPIEYAHLPQELLSHSVDHGDLQRFQGQRIVVVGGGQGAVEYAALLHEAGASVHVVARHPIFWLAPDRSSERGLFEQMLSPNAGIAPGWKNWAIEYLPYLFYRFPQPAKDRFIRNHYVPAASDWLRERIIGRVRLHEGHVLNKVDEAGGKVQAVLSDGSKIMADHIMLATGYRADISRLPMLHPSLLRQIQVDQGSPVLSPWFESSVPGLYFVGFTALHSFGPLYRFVVGCKATAPRVTRAIVREAEAGQ
jgi:cation diffusion facilitator CzcD-associated flavoprotein CzcO